MSLSAPFAVIYNDSTTKENGTKMKPGKSAMLASKKISARAWRRHAKTDKRYLIAASAGMSSTLKIIQRILQERIATNASQSWQKA